MKEAEISLWFPMSSFKEIQVKQKKNTHILKTSCIWKRHCVDSVYQKKFSKIILMTKTST